MYTIKKAIVSSVKQLSWKAVDFISTTTPLFNKGFQLIFWNALRTYGTFMLMPKSWQNFINDEYVWLITKEDLMSYSAYWMALT